MYVLNGFTRNIQNSDIIFLPGSALLPLRMTTVGVCFAGGVGGHMLGCLPAGT